jgi:hypothetical protein
MLGYEDGDGAGGFGDDEEGAEVASRRTGASSVSRGGLGPATPTTAATASPPRDYLHAGESPEQVPATPLSPANDGNLLMSTAGNTPLHRPPSSVAQRQPVVFLTESMAAPPPNVFRPASSMSTRCKTPDVTQFQRRPRPHAERGGGEFRDCDCTDRSTDDELDTVKEAFEGEDSQAAQARLECWRRGFAKTKVLTRGRLEARLVERRVEREAVCDDRRHFGALVKEAELGGSEWRINRQSRCTTPSVSSMWHTHFTSMAKDGHVLLQARNEYVALCDACEAIRFPANADDEVIAEEIRQRFVAGERLTPAFVLDVMRRHASVMLSKKITVKLLDVLRQHAKVPTTDFLQALQELTHKLQRQHKTAALSDPSLLRHRPVAHEVDSLVKRLQKLLGAATAAAHAGATGIMPSASVSIAPL